MARDASEGETRRLVLVLIVGLTWCSSVATVHGCQDIIKIVDCWRKNPEVPICDDSGYDTPLVACAEKLKSSLYVECSNPNITYSVNIMLDVYRARDEAICSNPGMRKVFRENELCWNFAKICTQSMTYASPEKYPIDCGEVYESLSDCRKTRDSRCMKWIDKLANAMFRASPCCAASNGIVWILLSITTAVILLNTVIPNG